MERVAMDQRGRAHLGPTSATGCRNDMGPIWAILKSKRALYSIYFDKLAQRQITFLYALKWET